VFGESAATLGTVKLVPVSEPTPRLLNRHPEQVVAAEIVGSAEGLVATISQYRLTPVTAFQLKVGVVETPVAPFAGELCTGAGRGAADCVANDHSGENCPS
jgi:hypothetical protein